MNLKTLVCKSLAPLGLLALAAPASAALVVYNTEASFLAAVGPAFIDTFAGFSITDQTSSPITRNAGPYAYTASSTSTFYGGGTVANPWLSPNAATDSITFSNFSAGVNAIGGLFFGSDVSGDFVSGTIRLIATDSLGATSTETIVGATATSFLGFQSNASLTSLVVSAVSPNATVWPSVDNLTLAVAGVTPVPEPETWAMMLAGLGLLGTAARRWR